MCCSWLKHFLAKFNNTFSSIIIIIIIIKFLQINPRYAKAGFFKAKTVKDQAIALQNAGYATAGDYANFINNVYKPYAKLIDEQKKAGFSYKTAAAALLFAIGATAISKYFKKWKELRKYRLK